MDHVISNCPAQVQDGVSPTRTPYTWMLIKFVDVVDRAAWDRAVKPRGVADDVQVDAAFQVGHWQRLGLRRELLATHPAQKTEDVRKYSYRMLVALEAWTYERSPDHGP